MTEFLALAVLALLVIAAAAVLAPRLRLAAPLILVAVGIGISLVPFLPEVEIDPEIVLHALLPPLLYAAAISMPAVSLRREFGPIRRLSVALVIITALLMGVLFQWLIPDLGFVWGVALGAILSPTDAVATSIIKGQGVPRRVVSILEGESLLNDATALVLLRTAVVATAAGFSFWAALGTFIYAVVVAVILGAAVGWLNVAVRSRIADPAVNTILTFTVPFLAAVPAELLNSSGLVAAVVAGLVTGTLAPRKIPPQHRASDRQTWAALELVLEGAVFLGMGLQLATILDQVHRDHIGIGPATGLAAVALAAVLLIRAAYMAPLLWRQSAREQRRATAHPKYLALQQHLDAGTFAEQVEERTGRAPAPQTVERYAGRIRRALADIDYRAGQPLGVREGTVVVWAGMRGAITVAAAQTLPLDAPHRPLLIFIAFAVAAISLGLQGGTVGWLASRLLRYRAEAIDQAASLSRAQALALLDDIEDSVETLDRETDLDHRLRILAAQRDALLDARDDGTLEVGVIREALRIVDTAQISWELRAEQRRHPEPDPDAEPEPPTEAPDGPSG